MFALENACLFLVELWEATRHFPSRQLNLQVQFVRDLDPVIHDGGGLGRPDERVRQGGVERLHLQIDYIRLYSALPIRRTMPRYLSDKMTDYCQKKNLQPFFTLTYLTQ